MSSNDHPIVQAVLSLREGQREQLDLSAQVLQLARAAAEVRRVEMQEFRDQWTQWLAENREQTRQALRRYRVLVRFYGGMMLLLGALLGLLWFKIFANL